MRVNICLLVSLKDIFNMLVYVKMTGEMINGDRGVNCIGSELSLNYCQVRRVSGILISFITKQFKKKRKKNSSIYTFSFTMQVLKTILFSIALHIYGHGN